MTARNAHCPNPTVYADEWDLLIGEFGLDSEPLPLPMAKMDIKKRLLARHTAEIPENGNE